MVWILGRGRSTRALPARPVARERGATSTEYALLIGLVAVVIIGAVAFFGGSVRQLFSSSGASMPGQQVAAGPSKPSPVTALVASPASGTSFLVSWTAPADTGGGPITYVVQTRNGTCSGGGSWTTLASGLTSTTFTSGNLGNGNKCIGVFASNGSYSSDLTSIQV